MKTKAEQIKATTATIRRKLSDKIEAAVEENIRRPARIAATQAVNAANSVTTGARNQLDQVLLDLEHKALNLVETQDMIQTVGRRVLARAEEIRVQVATSPLSPSWLKDLKLLQSTATISARFAGAAKSQPMKSQTSGAAAETATQKATEVKASEVKPASEGARNGARKAAGKKAAALRPSVTTTNGRKVTAKSAAVKANSSAARNNGSGAKAKQPLKAARPARASSTKASQK